MPTRLYATPFTQLLDAPTFRAGLTGQLLPDYLPRQRWFTSKGKTIAGVSVDRVLPVSPASALTLLSVRFTDGSSEAYQLPLALLALDGEVEAYRKQFPEQVVGGAAGAGVLVDAVGLAAFRSALYRMMRQQDQREDGLYCEAGKLLLHAPEELPSTVPAIDTSNTAIIYGNRFFFKLFRKLDPGLNPDLELVRYLSEETPFDHCPPYGGSLGLGKMDDPAFINLGLLSGKMDNRGDAWELFQQLTQNYYAGDGTVNVATRRRATLLGERTAQMHRALAAAGADHPDLRPKPMTIDYRKEITAAARKLLDRQMEQLKNKVDRLPPESLVLARQVIDKTFELDARLGALERRNVGGQLIRIHGDYHLGQVLTTDDDYVIIDFEGEPLLTIPERRRRRPALKDVAGMVRSFHYAAHAQLLLNPERYADQDTEMLSARAETWYQTVSRAYLDGYYGEAGQADFLPEVEEDRRALLELFMLEKAVYEVAYELNSRPAWLGIPLRGVLALAS